jgi:hypothetical protein
MKENSNNLSYEILMYSKAMSNRDYELTPELDRYLRRYRKRTGVFRMYRLNRPPERSTLLLEFVIRGRVLGQIKLWKRKSLFS